MISHCTVCGSSKLRKVLDLGPQPPSNRFVEPDMEKPKPCEYPLSLGDCAECGTVQLVDRMPIEAIRPRYEWLTNSEPEGHLDDLAQNLIDLPGIDAGTAFLGLTYKDRSLVKRLADRGYDAKELEASELQVFERPFGLETIQRSLSDVEFVKSLQRAYGFIRVVVGRHIIEHAESAVRFVSALRSLLQDGGYLVIEFPDNARILRGSDYAFIWEEHFTYFTEETFRSFAARVGAEIVRLDRYGYRHEDALVAVLRFQPDSDVLPRWEIPDDSILDRFSDSFVAERERWQRQLAEWATRGHKVAVFGAGHLAVKLINFMQLAPWLDCVIDDHPKKKGLLMPGSGLRIEPSSALRERGIDTCISTLSPESEMRVRCQLQDFFSRKGRFIAAFATSQES